MCFFSTISFTSDSPERVSLHLRRVIANLVEGLQMRLEEVIQIRSSLFGIRSDIHGDFGLERVLLHRPKMEEFVSYSKV